MTEQKQNTLVNLINMVVPAMFTICMAAYGYHQTEITKMREEMSEIRKEYATKEEVRASQDELLKRVDLRFENLTQKIEYGNNYIMLMYQTMNPRQREILSPKQ